MGMNLAGIADYSRELPFANLMKMSRTWYTKGENDPNFTFNTNLEDQLSYDGNGYPTHIPQTIPGEPLAQLVATIWDGTDSWPSGRYVLLWEGTGDFSFWGNLGNLVKVSDNRYEFDHANVPGGVLEITMTHSDVNDPVQNMRLLLPGTEDTHQEQAFNTDWLDLIKDFKTLRFMDWGHTNFWGQEDPYTWEISELADWDERASVNHYTYATNKGVPYELMIDLMNQLDINGWVCVPHRASDDYISNMANYFRDELETERKLYVEYSNEIWNWIFGQAQWLLQYPCEDGIATWPECIIPTIQNTLDIWSNSFSAEPERIIRVAAFQTGWLDVSERVIYNLRENSFDVISPTFYFSFNEESDATLDDLGANATIADIAYHTRIGRAEDLELIKGMKTISDSLNVPLAFYEGGQHMTPQPFGEEPSYAEALVGIHRDSSMYNLYTEWFELLRALNTTNEPIPLMHFSFIAAPSSRFGTWGILESMEQDLDVVPAPKYQSILENLGCVDINTSIYDSEYYESKIKIFPNPTNGIIQLRGIDDNHFVKLINSRGQIIQEMNPIKNQEMSIDLSNRPNGLYFIWIYSKEDFIQKSLKVLKH